jgi:hypothetical protein
LCIGFPPNRQVKDYVQTKAYHYLYEDGSH